MEIFDNTLMTLALGGLAVSLALFASALLYPYLRSAWNKATALARAAFCGAVVVACLFGGAKHKTGGITYPKTDTDVAYLTDAGSYVTNDAVHVAFTRVIVPDTATFYLDYCALDATNAQGVATNWVNAKTATFADLEVPFDFAFAAATNYNWMAYTDWTPGPAVQTNGVWHAYWGVDKKEGRYFIPVRTCVRDGGEVIATPKSKWDAKDPMELTEAEAYERYAPDTAIVVSVEAGTVYSFSYDRNSGRSSVTVDWGDGTTDTIANSSSASHTYAKGGRFCVRVSDDLYSFKTRDSVYPVALLRWGDSIISCDSSFYNCDSLIGFVPRWPSSTVRAVETFRNCGALNATTLPAWPKGIVTAQGTYRECPKLTAAPADWSGCTSLVNTFGTYMDDTSLAGSPSKWPPNATTIYYTYCNCKSLTGEVPEWPSKATDLTYVFAYCSSLSGNDKLPEWPQNVGSLNYTFCKCTSLRGEIPQVWPDSLETIHQVFDGCSRVTGHLPEKWGDNLADTMEAFRNCTGLTGSVPQWGNGKITNTTRMYGFCTGLTGPVPEWGENMTSAFVTFYGCSGLTGSIPKWGKNLKDVSYCFGYNCKNLTGAWTDDPAELMPTNITSHGDCVSGASDALRALFHSDWGGTRTKTE